MKEQLKVTLKLHVEVSTKKIVKIKAHKRIINGKTVKVRSHYRVIEGLTGSGIGLTASWRCLLPLCFIAEIMPLGVISVFIWERFFPIVFITGHEMVCFCGQITKSGGVGHKIGSKCGRLFPLNCSVSRNRQNASRKS